MQPLHLDIYYMYIPVACTKILKVTWKSLFCLPYVPSVWPPTRSELSGQNLQPPLRIKWSRHKVAILTSFWTFLNWIYYRYILNGLKISSIHLKRSVIHLKRSVIHFKISKSNFFFAFQFSGKNRVTSLPIFVTDLRHCILIVCIWQ